MTLAEAAQADDVARWNYPVWWITALQKAWPADWQNLLMAGNQQGPLTLRVNQRHTTVEAYLAKLQETRISATRAGEHAVRLATPMPVDRIPGFNQGTVSVQDAGAQLAAQWLGVQGGMRVLDACAAPGGKTGHLLELATIDLVALESDASRARRITENLQRLGLNADIRIGDAGTPSQWHNTDEPLFDRILADVPCSASGIVRRHPDIRWLRRASDIAALVAEQRRIMQALWPLLKPGGELLYVTCSVFPEEGEQQALWFESAQEDAVRLGAPGQLLPAVSNASDTPDTPDTPGMPTSLAVGFGTKPDTDPLPDHDGFFYARFQKR